MRCLVFSLGIFLLTFLRVIEHIFGLNPFLEKSCLYVSRENIPLACTQHFSSVKYIINSTYGSVICIYICVCEHAQLKNLIYLFDNLWEIGAFGHLCIHRLHTKKRSILWEPFGPGGRAASMTMPALNCIVYGIFMKPGYRVCGHIISDTFDNQPDRL